MFALELSTSAIALAAITQLPGGGRSRRARSTPQAVRDGAKRSRSTGPRTTGQFVGVMAAACGHQVPSARTHETNGTRGLEDSEEATGGDRLG
jgi:hypothetical protein